MKKLIVLLMVVLFAVPAFGANVRLTWEAPTTNEDGTPLTDLAGYKLFMGTATGNYTGSVDVNNVLNYVWNVGDVEEETRFFNVKAYDDKGNESDFNGEVAIPFGANPPSPATNLQGAIVP